MQANPHSHGMTDPGHSHPMTGHDARRAIVDEDYLPPHLSIHKNCRCSLTAIAPEVLKAARADEYQLMVKFDPATIDVLMDEMRKTIAAAFGLKPEMLFGGEPPPPVSHEFRALMTVAAFPHTPE